ncbi:MAG: YggT family protein [Clostridia bacterium]|nr:YggT family protein [Clostridia bacterium]
MNGDNKSPREYNEVDFSDNKPAGDSRAAGIYSEPRWFIQTRNTIYYILGVIEVLMAFRLVFKLLGANPGNGFVMFLYSLTRMLAAPFFGIFNTLTSGADGVQIIFEPAIIVAMIVYALIAKGLINLARLKLSDNIAK